MYYSIIYQNNPKLNQSKRHFQNYIEMNKIVFNKRVKSYNIRNKIIFYQINIKQLTSVIQRRIHQK